MDKTEAQFLLKLAVESSSRVSTYGHDDYIARFKSILNCIKENYLEMTKENNENIKNIQQLDIAEKRQYNKQK